MSGYADLDPNDVPQFLTSADISRLFQRQANWFADSKVRRKLYRQGFPHPVQAGRWSPLAVRNWQSRAGENLRGKLPSDRKRGRAATYAEPPGGRDA
jgi:hypothetical protein